MMDEKYSPVYLLRAYIWQLLKANTAMTEDDYDQDGDGGLVPIVPVAEEPELTQFNKPYIVYGYATSPAPDGQFFRNRGSMSMVVYSTKFGEIVTILNILQAAFEREDEAARDVNEFTSLVPQFHGMSFRTISLGFLEGPSPEEAEGGRQSGLINIRFEYSVDYNITTTVLPA